MPKRQPDKPEWPTSPRDKSRLSALANWVQDELPKAHEQWGDEIFDFDPVAREGESYLRKSEKAVLLAAFDKRGKHRWSGVAAVLRSGMASPRLQAVVAYLIDNGGFAPAAKLGPDKAKDAAVFHETRLIEKILRRDYYPKQSQKKCRDMAPLMMAILRYPFNPNVSDLELVDSQKTAVRRAVKLLKDKRRQALGLIRWRIAAELTTAD